MSLQLKRVLEVPLIKEPSTLYFIQASDADLMDVLITDQSGDELYRVVTKDDIVGLIGQSITSTGGITVVLNLIERDALNPTAVSLVLVLDASDDITVTAGSALYVYSPDLLSWIKLSEYESLEGNLNWAAILNKPSSSVSQIDALVTQQHNHTNLTVLDKLSEDVNQSFSFDIQSIEQDLIGTVDAVIGKADISHTHDTTSVVDLLSQLATKANQSDVANLSPDVHNHLLSDQPNIISAVADKADNTHTHAYTDITDLETVIGGSVTIAGPSSVGVGLTEVYTITNYDIATVYNLSSSNGSVSRNNDTILYTPAVAGAGGFNLNGREIAISVINRIETPAITSPLTGSINQSLSLDFTSSVFDINPSGYESHLSTDWEVALDPAFSTIVFSRYNDTINKTSWSDVRYFSPNTVYYVRVRYHSITLTSAWSNPITFTTRAVSIPSTETAILMASNKAASDGYALSVAISTDGTRLVIGSWQSDVAGLSNAGSAYVYVRNGSSWTEEAILTASDKAVSAQFGNYVCIDGAGDRIGVAANLANYGGVTDCGAVYVFARSGTTWTEEAQLIASVKTTNDQLGRHVAITPDGTRLVATTQAADYSSLTDAGRAFVYVRSGTVWTEEIVLYPDTPQTNGLFGRYSAITDTGDRIAIGAMGMSDGGVTSCGVVYIFVRSGVSWAQEAKLTASDKAASDQFGRSVALSDLGTILAVGSNLDDVDAVSNTGSVYIFTRSGSTWTQEARLNPVTKVAGDGLGVSVVLSGDGRLLACSANFADISSIVDCGAVYLFLRNDSGVWVESGTLTASNKAANDQFGSSLSMTPDGITLVVGAYLANPGGIIDAGAAYIFG